MTTKMFYFDLAILFLLTSSIFAADVTFVGQIFFYDTTNSYRGYLPLPSVKIEIMDKDISSNYSLGEGYADADGNFNISIDRAIIENADSSSGPDIFFKIHAQNDAGSVHERFDDSSDPDYNPTPYVFDTTDVFNGTVSEDATSLAIWNNWSVLSEFQAGSLVACVDVQNSPTWTLLDEMFDCWVVTDILDGGGTQPDPLKVLCDPDGIISGYARNLGLMFWDGHTASREDVRFGIRHEYGHYVMDTYSYDNAPLGVDHDWEVPFPDTLEGRQLAWSEGWASFFAGAVVNNPWMRDELNSPGKTLEETLMGAAGPTSEAAIAGLLWDLLDGPASDSVLGNPTPDDDDDGVDYTFQQIFDIIVNEAYFNGNSDATVDDFALAWVVTYGDTPSNRNVFAMHGIAFGGTSEAPDSPSNLYASSSSGAHINLKWDDNSDNELGFRIYRSNSIPGPPGGHNGMDLIRTVGTNITLFSDIDVSSGELYCYQVYAYNSVGESEIYHEYLCVVAPEGDSVKPPINLQAQVLSHDQIKLTWIYDAANPATQFMIRRATTPSDDPTDWNWLGSVGASNEEYVSVGLEADTRYYYRLHPVTDQGFHGDIYATVDAKTESLDPPNRTISGYVHDSGSNGISGVEVSANNGGTSATTNFFGYYNISVVSGWSGRVTLTPKPGYDFSISYHDYTSVTSNHTNQNYTGTFMYAGGSGTEFAPLQIATLECFQRLGNRPSEWGQHFILMADINLTGLTYTTAVIAPDTVPANDIFDGITFSGIFNGNGHKIFNMTIEGDPGNENLGLFGEIDDEGSVVNLSLENVNLICRGDRSGALCGTNEGTISNCSSSGTIINDTFYADDDADYMGGLCGYNSTPSSNIENSISSCNISLIGDGSYYGTGGLCGFNEGSIAACHSTGRIQSDGKAVGGLCGLNFGGSISGSYSIGSTNGSDNVGGLCGFNDYGIISTSYSTGATYGNYRVGGLCGWNLNATIDNCYSTGIVSSGDNSSSIGGLCGSNFSGLILFTFGSAKDSVILNCYATGDVIVGNGCSSVGGLSGSSDSGGVNLSSGDKCEITDCYSSGKITIGDGCSFVGGFCGSSICNTSSGPCIIKNCFSNSAITGGANNQELGGLCGRLYSADVSSCQSKGDISVSSNSSYIGGFCGRNTGGTEIIDSYSTGNVDCSGGCLYIGGFNGENEAVINRCYSEGDVNAGDSTSYYVGGLCGYNLGGNIFNCYSISNVESGRRGGGFCGKNNGGTINYCYSSGNLRFSYDLGYFCAVNDNGGSINYCFWDVEVADWYTNPEDDNYGAIGKTTIDMQTLYTFTNAGWDFVSETDNGTEDYWRQPYQVGYPILYWQRDIPGDFTDSYGVNIIDFAVLAEEWLDFELSMDKSGDGFVNLQDWAIFANGWDGNMSQISDFASQWLKTGKNELLTDIAPQPNGDGIVNILDFAVLAEYWLEGVEQ